jgi:hypothetical protein
MNAHDLGPAISETEFGAIEQAVDDEQSELFAGSMGQG